MPDVTTRGYPPAGSPASAHPIVLDAAFRDLLASALIARHRAQIRNQPELMFMRSTWDADEWARTEADTLLAHIRTVLAHRAEQKSPSCRPPDAGVAR